MKRLIYFSQSLALSLLYGCTYGNLNDLPDSSDETLLTTTDIEQDIVASVMTSRYGGFCKNKPTTRASGDFSLSPYVVDGDTVMYIVQYKDGWEAYSATKAAPMLLFSSPEGRFNLSGADVPPALRAMFTSTVSNLSDIIESGAENVDSSWSIVHNSSEELKDGKITIDEEMIAKINRPVSRSSGEPKSFGSEDEGHWVLLETEVISQSTETTPKLIQTKWGQSYPWNIYTPLLPDGSSYKNAVVGCLAVATAQYLYYTHYKDGIPMNTIDTATRTSDGLDFTFSGSSSTIWDNMARMWYDYGTENAALLLGYVGRKVNTDYGLNNSSASTSDMTSYLKSIYGVDFYTSKPEFSVIWKSLVKSYPLITYAGRDNGAHQFIIDQHTVTYTTTRYIYGWEGPYDRYGNGIYEDTNDRDEEGNIIGWAIQNEIVKNTKSKEGVSMNWGGEGLYDNVFQYNITSWTAGDKIYNKNHIIFLRKDIQ